MSRKFKTHHLLQSQIENAMKVTRSNRSAAEYLRVTYNTYKKYAKAYKNSAGVTLFDAHKNQKGAGIPKMNSSDKRFKLDDIILNKHPNYPREKVFKRLIVNGYLEERCNMCGFCTKRPTDFRAPLILNFLNGNKRDYRLDNLEVICYNCYFVHVGNLLSRDLKVSAPERAEEIGSTQEALESGASMNAFDVLTEEEKLEMMRSLENL